MSLNQPAFAERIKSSLKQNLKRPNCLSLKTKLNLRRHEVIELMKKIKFGTRKLVGVAEMKSRSIDITCRTRQDVLELYEKLREVDNVYHVRLYESDHINVLLGWVSIPLPNERFKQSIEATYGKVAKLIEKRHKDGLRSGIRILSMNKDELDVNPIPSYIFIDGFELFVTYSGQQVTYL